MNLVITDAANKRYQFYPFVNEATELFICDNINAINRKNNTYLTVQTAIDPANLSSKGYVLDIGMFDRLVLNYNNELQPGEQILQPWKRGL